MHMLLRARVFLRLSLAATALAQVAESPVRIPELHATALSGERIDLPQALRGHTAVLILGFSQSSRNAVTLWSRALAEDFRNSPTVLYFELPVVAGIPRLLRGMVIGRMKSDVPTQAQPRFVPVADREGEWKSAAGYSRQTPEDQAYLLVVDGSGVIHARFAAGPPTGAAYANLKRQLQTATRN